MPTNVIMPQLGESVVEGTISRWLKQEGDAVAAYEPLLEVSTDKVDTEVPAATDGVLLKIYVQEGETVEHGTLLGVIGAPGEAVADAPDAGSAEAVGQPAPASPLRSNASERNGSTSYSGHLTPVVARMVADHNLDPAQISGTGRGGRVTKKDVQAYLAARESAGTAAQATAPVAAPATADTDLPPWEQPGTGNLFKPTVDYGGDPVATPAPAPLPAQQAPAEAPSSTPNAQTLPGELVPQSSMRRQIAEHMVRSVRTAPHVTTVFEVDLAAVVAHRAANKAAFDQQGVNLTYTAYFVAASVAALRANPIINARWTDAGIYLYQTMHIGVAVALPDGLIVPVIKHAQDLNLLGTARAVNDLALRAREKQLRPDEVQGGTFTITNHGVSGSLFATPIINQPQVGILGVGALEKRVKVITDDFGNDTLAIRPCLYVSLTFDHRVADGAAGDAFLATLKQTLETWT
ncbi:MAG: 2-oxo acid dehydrogenase subunit E2 [Chloroflexi bacterium]|nr:2-oxo acid dehydrogenase subunit E2 [Chloroflexota bacterium]